MFKTILTASMSLLLSFSAYAGNPEAKVQEKTKKAANSPKPAMTFEDCCDEQYGDSEACQKLTHVTNKTKSLKGKKVQKKCFEEDDIDSSLLDE